MLIALDYHLVDGFAAARSERPADKFVTILFMVGQFVRRVSSKGGNLCIYHVGADGVLCICAKIGVVDNVGSRGGSLVDSSQGNIAGNLNGLAGLVGIAVVVSPAGEVVAFAIQKDFRLLCFGRTAALIGLGVLDRLLAVFLIGHRIRNGVTGKHGFQCNRRIQFGVYVKQSSVLCTPGNRFLIAICLGKVVQHLIVARGLGKGAAVGNGERSGFSVHGHAEVNGCINGLGLPHRVGGQATGGHGFGKLELLGTLGIRKPTGKLVSFGGSRRRRRILRQGIYRLLVFVADGILNVRTIFVQEGDLVGVTGVVEFGAVVGFAVFCRISISIAGFIMMVGKTGYSIMIFF